MTSSIGNEIDSEAKSRFNACLFIGQYLMRNNPKYKSAETYETVGYVRFQRFVEKKKKRRFFRVHRLLLKKLFVHKLGKKECTPEEAGTFVEVLDGLLKLEGALKTCWVGPPDLT